MTSGSDANTIPTLYCIKHSSYFRPMLTEQRLHDYPVLINVVFINVVTMQKTR